MDKDTIPESTRFGGSSASLSPSTRFAGALNALHCKVREGVSQKHPRDLSSEPAFPVIDVNA